MNFGKNPQHYFPKMRGGGQRPFGTFPNIHPFLKGKASLKNENKHTSIQDVRHVSKSYSYTTFQESSAGRELTLMDLPGGN